MKTHTKFLTLFVGFVLGAFMWPVPSSAQISIVPGSAARGAKLFTDYDSRCRLASRSGDATLDAGKPSALAAIQRAGNVGFDRFFE